MNSLRQASLPAYCLYLALPQQCHPCFLRQQEASYVAHLCRLGLQPGTRDLLCIGVDLNDDLQPSSDQRHAKSGHEASVGDELLEN